MYTGQKLLGVTTFAAGRPRISHGMTRFAHPVRYVFAEPFNMARGFSGFSVTLSAIASIVRLVCPVGERDPVFEFENFRIISRKRRCSYEKNCRN